MESITPHFTSRNFFVFLVCAAQILGPAALAMTTIWMKNYRGGFAWQDDPGHEFNFHPVFMVLGMIILYGEAILVYRVFRHAPKLFVKILHSVLHIAAMACTGFGLNAVFDSHILHKGGPMPNVYSLHSWVGIFAVGCFALQWVVGFLAFLYPQASQWMRAAYKSVHVFWGIAILILATASALLGITEKIIFSGVAYGSLPPEAYFANFLGLTLIIFTMVVVYLVVKEDYKRQPEPEENISHLNLLE